MLWLQLREVFMLGLACLGMGVSVHMYLPGLDFIARSLAGVVPASAATLCAVLAHVYVLADAGIQSSMSSLQGMVLLFFYFGTFLLGYQLRAQWMARA